MSQIFQWPGKDTALGLVLFLVCIQGAVALGQSPYFDSPDWYSFVVSARLHALGTNPFVAYPVDGPLAFDMTGYAFPEIRPNANSPLLLPLFSFVSSIDASISLLLVRIVTLLIVAVCLVCWRTDDRDFAVAALLVCFSSGLASTLRHGQVYAPLLLLIMLAAWTESRESRASRCVGGAMLGLLIAAKPNFALLLLCLVAGRDYVRAALATAVPCLLYALAVSVEGPGLFLQWLEALDALTQGVRLDEGASFGMTGLSAFVSVIPSEVLSVMAILLLIFVLVACRRIGPKSRELLAIGTILSILLSPLGWVGYSLCVAPFALSLLKRRSSLIPGVLVALDVRTWVGLLMLFGIQPPSWTRWVNTVGLMGLLTLLLVVALRGNRQATIRAP